MPDLIIDLKNFPTTRYQGSKRKIIPWIYESVKNLKFDTVLDGFGGSASVSYLFKKMGKSVTYNDNLKFNFLIGKALIENQSVTLNDGDKSFLLNFNDSKDFSIVQKHFKDIYYYESENKWIDNRIAGITNLNSYPIEILNYKKALCYYALFQSCLVKRPFNLFHRKNLYLRKNKVERTFGNYKTWNTKFETHFNKFIDEENNLVFDNNKSCYAINESVFDLNPKKFDLVYLDAPYFRKNTSNETSMYSKTYHFLEGISRYNEWEQLLDNDSPNKRFKSKYVVNTIGEKDILESFEILFDKFRNSIIVVSYKKGGTPSIETLVRLLKRIKNNVSTKSLHYKYALNHQNGDAKNNREVLIIGL